ncbi:MAG: YkvA family protein [Flammeovirgaceae bacterium]
MMLADLIPDFIPFLGFSDDALIIAWVYNSVRKDLEAFEEWENTFAVELED